MKTRPPRSSCLPHLQVVGDFERTTLPDGRGPAAEHRRQDLPQVLQPQEGDALGHRRHLQTSLGRREA